MMTPPFVTLPTENTSEKLAHRHHIIEPLDGSGAELLTSTKPVCPCGGPCFRYEDNPQDCRPSACESTETAIILEAQAMNPKPGWKTTEFWLTTIASVVGALIASGQFDEHSPFGKGLALLAVVLPVLGYNVSRGIAKYTGGRQQ